MGILEIEGTGARIPAWCVGFMFEGQWDSRALREENPVSCILSWFASLMSWGLLIAGLLTSDSGE